MPDSTLSAPCRALRSRYPYALLDRYPSAALYSIGPKPSGEAPFRSSVRANPASTPAATNAAPSSPIDAFRPTPIGPLRPRSGSSLPCTDSMRRKYSSTSSYPHPVAPAACQSS